MRLHNINLARLKTAILISILIATVIMLSIGIGWGSGKMAIYFPEI